MVLHISVRLACQPTAVFERRRYMSLQAHLDTLKERHAALELRIADEDQRPRPDSETLLRLKVEKLKVKEEMERLRSQTA
jgi:hypothetical protein